MSKHQVAGAAEVLRSSQKDEEYMRYMKNLNADIIQRTLGIPFWLRWKDFCSTFSDLLFFSLTTISGLQTLGEEYANIIQVDKTLTTVPSKWRRVMDVGLRTYGYYFLLRFQSFLENQINAITSDSDSFEIEIAACLPIVFKVIAVLQRLHLIVFYFCGSYYHISKRITGIKYVVIRRWLSHPTFQTPYKILAWIAASQLCLSLCMSLYSINLKKSFTCPKKTEDKGNSSATTVTLKDQCSLCLEKRNYSTATPCGHLFCWSCITSWMQNKEECPLCRETFPPSKLLYLQNYD